MQRALRQGLAAIGQLLPSRWSRVQVAFQAASEADGARLVGFLLWTLSEGQPWAARATVCLIASTDETGRATVTVQADDWSDFVSSLNALSAMFPGLQLSLVSVTADASVVGPELARLVALGFDQSAGPDGYSTLIAA